MIPARKGLSALVLAGWALPCLYLALFPETGVQLFFGSMGAIYGLAAVALVARWFWARWFAVGVSWWGAFTGGSLMFFTGVGAFLVLFTLSHLAVIGLLHAREVRVDYEGQPGWRERWKLDDRGASRIGGMVTNLGTLLPFVAFYAFGPAGVAAGPTVAMVLAALGAVAILRMRTWGLFAVAGAGVVLAATAGAGCFGTGAVAVGALLALSTVRFAPDVARWLRA